MGKIILAILVALETIVEEVFKEDLLVFVKVIDFSNMFI